MQGSQRNSVVMGRVEALVALLIKRSGISLLQSDCRTRMSKHFSKTEFEYPVHRICGKISSRSKVVHKCTASGKFTTYLQGERDLVAHPVSQAELDRRATFKTRQALVAARLKKTATTYETDIAAYRAQCDTGYKSFPKYIWAQVIADEA